VRAISHRAQAHELFILATTAKNVDDEALVRKRTSYPLATVRKRTSY
jgi:DNA topoisomerase IB